MAIAEIKKMRILGLKTEENAILSALQKTNRAEIKETADFDMLYKGLQGDKDDLQEKLSRLVFAINLIDEAKKEQQKYSQEKKEKKPLFSARSDVSFHDFNLITAREYEIFSKIESLEKLSEGLSVLKSRNSKLLNTIEQLRIFADISLPLNSFKDTKNVSIMLGTLPTDGVNAFKALSEKEADAITEVFPSNSSLSAAVAICHKSETERLMTALTAIGFARVSFSYDKNVSGIIKDCRTEMNEIKKEQKKLTDEIVEFKSSLSEIKLLYDYLNLAAVKREYENNFQCSASTFILECFVPSESVNGILNAISECTANVVTDILDVNEKDNPPTFAQNKPLVEPFEAVTNMYSVPSYGERDPNAFVGIFFFIFFGIMLCDAGYGLLLAIGASILLRKFRMETGMRRLVKIIMLGGISTIIWGALFGGWFGIELDKVGDNAVTRFLLSLRWFNPMSEPLMMLGLCLGLGVFQILFGLGLKAAELIGKGKILDALMDVGSWYLFFIGIGMIALGLLPEFAALSNISMYVLIAGLLMLVLTQGRAQKGIFSKLFKGIASLYGIVNYLSDILSYARLFGLGLASGVVALVMNTIGSLLISTHWILIPLGVAILLGGHIFNIAINVLGAYIHNCRLQYIEFFSRFYKGGGHVFKPYGGDLKYYSISR